MKVRDSAKQCLFIIRKALIFILSEDDSFELISHRFDQLRWVMMSIISHSGFLNRKSQHVHLSEQVGEASKEEQVTG